MKHISSILFLTLFGPTFTYAQDCCNGFEANFSYSPSIVTNGIEFVNQSTGSWSFIVWDFGDGTSSNDENPAHVYNEPGIYQVCVVLENNDDCRSELCYDVAVETTPDPCNDFLSDFLWEVNGSNSLGVQFENISPITPDAHYWHFGDGATSTVNEPYHEYTEAGMYQVCLVIENNDDCRSEYCSDVCVSAPEPPEATNCCEGFEANFTYAPSQTDNWMIFENLSVGDWDAIVWNFGDGETSTQTDPHHEFPHPGIFQVCVVIESNDGCRSEMCYEVAVETIPDPCNDFLSDFTWNENIDSLGIQFENICPLVPDHYYWHFGDGTTSTDPNPYHEYSHPGVYQVCLVIENNDDCRSEYCRSVCVEEFNPCADFEVSFSWSVGFSSNHLIEFDGIYSGQIDGISWDFGDGSTSNDENPHHEYAEPGLYEVCVSIENSEGCLSEYCHMVAVETTPDPCENFEADFAYIVDYENGGVHFEDLSTGSPTSYHWTFGDGTGSLDHEPVHHYDHAGLFHVCLVIENDEGCVAEMCMLVHLPSYYFYMTGPLGITEESRETVGIYPNPFDQSLNFAEPLNGLLQVIDMQGKVVISRHVNAVSTLLTGELSSGLYVLQISDDRSVRTTKIIKY